jgi:hypothetical protein
MKKFLIIGLTLLAIFFASESAQAHRWGFGVVIAPPLFLPPPPGIYYRGYYPPPGYYYGPNYYYYYNDPYRVWVPGHWEDRQTPNGWERVWIPGYWRYGP